MPIVEFANRNQRTLLLSIEPSGHRIEVPHLARAGIRYALPEQAEDRYYAAIGDHWVDVWCETANYAVDVVLPSPCDRLLWRICVEGGCCGGIVDDAPVAVTDPLPSSGTLTAGEFAELVLRAEGGSVTQPASATLRRRIETMFVECFGRTEVEVGEFHRVTRRPFDPAPGGSGTGELAPPTPPPAATGR